MRQVNDGSGWVFGTMLFIMMIGLPALRYCDPPKKEVVKKESKQVNSGKITKAEEKEDDLDDEGLSPQAVGSPGMSPMGGGLGF
jgi:hypothetical protein